jgi:RNA polymerase sigma-70 factor (ECF subfamily)
MLATIDGRADAVFSFVVRVDRITEVFAVRNPDKLSQWP